LQGHKTVYFDFSMLYIYYNFATLQANILILISILKD